MPVRFVPEYAAWALGFGVFVALVGSAVVAPPDPVSQLWAAFALAAVTVPVMYWVVARAWARRERGARRLLFAHFAVASVASVAAALGVGGVVDDWTVTTTVVRALAFVATFLVVSWLFYGRSAPETANA